MRYAIRVGGVGRHAFRARCIIGMALALVASACGSDDGKSGAPARFAVLSAFPAELAAVLALTHVDETVTIDDHVFRLGTIGRVRVVVAMTGIGLANASTTTGLLLDNFTVNGVVVSGVAGSAYRIGDVAVPEAWTLVDDGTYDCHAPWLEVAKELELPRALTLEHCTEVPATKQAVCLPFDPVVVVGGLGHSADTYNGRAFRCTPNSGDVFGCDVEAPAPTQSSADRPALRAVVTAVDPAPVEDMETAAIGREALARQVPFIAFRATSDGAEDPLMLPGFPAQFFAYYRLAAQNAAEASAAFLERVSRR
jgi:nucleoside phosphorylase